MLVIQQSLSKIGHLNAVNVDERPALCLSLYYKDKTMISSGKFVYVGFLMPIQTLVIKSDAKG